MKYRRTITATLIFLAGCLFLLYGVHRKEHLTVEQNQISSAWNVSALVRRLR